jgi:AraC-like DNA-binding protein
MQLPAVPAGLYVEPWPPVLATRGPGSLRAVHAHHAMHFVLAVGGDLRVRASQRSPWQTSAGALTSPDAPHAVDARGFDMLTIFIDPESDVGATLRPALQTPIRLLSTAERDELMRGVEDPRSVVRSGLDQWARRAARSLGLSAVTPSRVLHSSVRKLLARLRTSGLDDDTSLEVLAEAVGLSPGRLMHTFTESIGIPLRPYLSWLRVQRAACAILDGASLTEAAHLAGFSDASHMYRTFRRRLGTTPSALWPVHCSARRAPHPSTVTQRGI